MAPWVLLMRSTKGKREIKCQAIKYAIVIFERRENWKDEL
jgi:hypothetical protein